MTAELTTPRSRRAILAAAVGAGVATVAATLGRPLAVRAADGEAVLVGATYSASNTTEFDTTSPVAALAGTGTTDTGVFGSSNSGNGVFGVSYSGNGVYGSGKAGIGVLASSQTNIAMSSESSANNKPAVLGQSVGSSTGLQGHSGAGSVVAAPSKTGVYGYAAQDANARGVTGQSKAGYGVSGLATSGRGTSGNATTGFGAFGGATSGIGTRGYAASGTAAYFSTGGPKSGTALRAIGKVTLDNCAGVATIASGHRRVTVTPGCDLSATSAAVATLMGSAGGKTTVQRVAINATADTLTIYLTANATAAVKVAWHVFG